MSYPKVSVVIPAYNASKTIINALRSIFIQTIPIYEIIVVNDGSTDETLSIIEGFVIKNKINNLIIINQKNSGPAEARNNAIRKTSGDWIAFLDADDCWIAEKTYKQLQTLKKNHDAVIIGSLVYDQKRFYVENSFSQITFGKLLFKNYFLTSSVIVRKDILTNYHFDKFQKYAEDYKLWLEIIYKFKGIVLKEGLIVYAENERNYDRHALSNNLVKMEKGELSNFWYLLVNGKINILTFIIVILFSLLKFLKRLLLVTFYKSSVIFYKK